MSAKPETSASVVEPVRIAYEAFREGGPEALLERYDEFFRPDFEFHPALIGRIEGGAKYVGRDEFAEYWREFRSVFSDPEFTEATFEPLPGGRVLAASRIRARGASSGAPIDQEAAYLFEVEDGLVASMRTFFSRSEAEEFAARA